MYFAQFICFIIAKYVDRIYKKRKKEKSKQINLFLKEKRSRKWHQDKEKHIDIIEYTVIHVFCLFLFYKLPKKNPVPFMDHVSWVCPNLFLLG